MSDVNQGSISGSVSGTLSWSLVQASEYEIKYLLTFVNYEDAGSTITFPLAFQNQCDLFTGKTLSTALSGSTLTKAHLVTGSIGSAVNGVALISGN
jgi:hypothetical protein